MRINTNLTAMNTFNQVTKNQNSISSAVAKLSSGYAINTAADNAAGLAISEKMRAQIRGLDRASANAQDAISLVQTAEGALDSSTQILQRMRQLAVQSASDTNENEIDRSALQDEFSQLQKELNDISQNTTFNKKNLLDGSLATTKTTSGSLTQMAAGSLVASFGNVSAGQYKFGVQLVTTAPATAAKKPDTATVNTSTLNASYFKDAKATIGSDVAASALLNGNYTVSGVSVNDSNKTFKLTVTGDNGQSFTSGDISTSYLTAGNKITANFGDNAFSIDFTLADTFQGATETADAVSKVTESDGTVAAKVTMDFSSFLNTQIEEGKTYSFNIDGQDYNYTAVEGNKAADVLTAIANQVTTLKGSNASTVVGTTAVKDGVLTFTQTTAAATTIGTISAKYNTGKLGTDALKNFGDSFKDTALSVSGGVNYTAATKELQATMTGASNVTLKAGDTSVTFDNGITVSFDKLTNADLNTEGAASLVDSAKITGVTSDGVGTASKFDHAKVDFANKISAGDYTITTATLHAVTATDATAAHLLSINASTHNIESSTKSASLKSDGGSGYVLTLEGIEYTASAADTSATVAGSAAGNFTFTNKATGATVQLSLYNNESDASAVHSGSYLLNKAITSGFGTATAAVGAAAADGQYKITASNGTDSYVSYGSTAGINADNFTATNHDYAFSFIGKDGSNAFTLTLSTGTTAITDGNETAAVNAIKFTSVDKDFNYEKTFGTKDSTIEAVKTANAGLTFQVGANQGDEITINVEKLDAQYLGVNGASIATRNDASKAITTVDKAINRVSAQRATLGAIQNRIQYKIDNLNTSNQNLTAAESQIRDVDMAKEMTAFTNANILSQASTAMLAQANSLPQSVLKLIGG